MDRFISIEGLDGSGKSTQIRMLCGYLDVCGIPYRYVHFPRLNEGVFGTLIAAYLRGELGALETIHPKLVAILYAGDRRDFARQMELWFEAGYFVIADRYVHSNLAYQSAKCSTAEAKHELRNWIRDLEYKDFGIPVPRLTLYLDVPVLHTGHAMRKDSKRDGRDYLNGADDIHESDVAYQDLVREEYLAILKEDPAMLCVMGVDTSGNRLGADEIHLQIVALLARHGLIPADQNADKRQ